MWCTGALPAAPSKPPAYGRRFARSAVRFYPPPPKRLAGRAFPLFACPAALAHNPYSVATHRPDANVFRRTKIRDRCAAREGGSGNRMGVGLPRSTPILSIVALLAGLLFCGRRGCWLRVLRMFTVLPQQRPSMAKGACWLDLRGGRRFSTAPDWPVFPSRVRQAIGKIWRPSHVKVNLWPPGTTPSVDRRYDTDKAALFTARRIAHSGGLPKRAPAKLPSGAPSSKHGHRPNCNRGPVRMSFPDETDPLWWGWG